MITALAWASAGLSLLLAALAGLACAADRHVDRLQLLAAAATEVGMVVQAVAGVVLLVRADSGTSGHRHVSVAVFGGYLLASVLVPVLGALWALGERSRWGTGVLTVAGLASAILVARLEQVWRVGG